MTGFAYAWPKSPSNASPLGIGTTSPFPNAGNNGYIEIGSTAKRPAAFDASNALIATLTTSSISAANLASLRYDGARIVPGTDDVILKYSSNGIVPVTWSGGTITLSTFDTIFLRFASASAIGSLPTGVYRYNRTTNNVGTSVQSVISDWDVNTSGQVIFRSTWTHTVTGDVHLIFVKASVPASGAGTLITQGDYIVQSTDTYAASGFRSLITDSGTALWMGINDVGSGGSVVQDFIRVDSGGTLAFATKIQLPNTASGGGNDAVRCIGNTMYYTPMVAGSIKFLSVDISTLGPVVEWKSPFTLLANTGVSGNLFGFRAGNSHGFSYVSLVDHFMPNGTFLSIPAPYQAAYVSCSWSTSGAFDRAWIVFARLTGTATPANIFNYGHAFVPRGGQSSTDFMLATQFVDSAGGQDSLVSHIYYKYDDTLPEFDLDVSAVGSLTYTVHLSGDGYVPLSGGTWSVGQIAIG